MTFTDAWSSCCFIYLSDISPFYSVVGFRAILIHTAQIGYARDPAYELNAPGQASLLDRIAVAIQQEASLQQACQEEGIEGDWVGSHGSWRMRLTTHSPRGRL